MKYDGKPAQSLRPQLMLGAMFAGGVVLPVLGSLALDSFLTARSWASLPFHSTLEMGGAVLGLVLAVIILFSQQKAHTSRRMWISCALIAMAVLDIFHGSVRLGDSFVWLHGLASLAGGLLFALVWFPERMIPRAAALAAAGATLLLATLTGSFCALAPENLPAALAAGGGFTPVTIAITLLGGGLLVLAAINFAVRYAQTRQQEEMLFLMVCLLFGMAGLLFPLSSLWGVDWWFWHLLRFGGYLFAFWLAMLSYRRSESEMIRAHNELDSLFQVAIDGKRLVDPDFNQLRTNDTFIELAGVSREAAGKMKCHEAFHGPLCGTTECPIRQLETGVLHTIEAEVVKTRKDGRQLTCIMKAARLNAPDGSFRGIIESFLDITDRKRAADQLAHQAALKSAQAELSDLMRGDLPMEALTQNIISFLCRQGEAQTGLIYLANEDGVLRLTAGYAQARNLPQTDYKPGQGLVGQAALEKRELMLSEVPAPYFTTIESGLGAALPRHIFIKPIVHNGGVRAVIELGSLHGFGPFLSQFLGMVSESIAMAVESVANRTRLAAALAESQQLTEELQAQQEELRTANEELEQQTRRLQDSEEQLKTQQEELQVTNAELEEKNDLLERQKEQVEQARSDIEQKAVELAQASRYKSEFLANMSHELRTPLNSLLLLAQGLARNREGNLSGEQIESARIIHASGTDLLTLINEILDLSKIEAGRIDLQPGQIRVSELAEGVRASFLHLIRDKGLELEIVVSGDAPAVITSDRQRVEQIIRNLMSNAVKFTEAGKVTVTFDRPATDPDPEGWLAVTVRDTGIGIAPELHRVIFEAFQQGDGGTGRKYGGTGLGLSISTKLAALLGGKIRLESEPGRGSAFTLYLPAAAGSPLAGGAQGQTPMTRTAPGPPDTVSQTPVQDDRDHLDPTDQAILIIEDDPAFARLLCDKCHEKGCKALTASTGEAGLALAARYLPRAVILDLRLPGMDGWTVLSALKDDTRTRHIPVHIVSVEEPSAESIRRGAVGHVTKPVKPEGIEEIFRRLEEVAAGKPGRVLLVDADPEMRRETARLIGNGDITVTEAASGEEALAALRGGRYDCVILDLGLPDMEGGELLARLERHGLALPPVIVYTARDLSRDEETALRERADSIVIKNVHSQERLLDEVSLFLHRVVSRMPGEKQQMIHTLHDTDTIFRGRKVLVVDDDMRTTFALSRLLAERGVQPLKAENGERALKLLAEQPDIDLVLMDVMMPVMDGYEAMRSIRTGGEQTRKVPIIALTAKAMPEDREKCLAAGANDYLPKPLDEGRLFSMMRIWLYR